MQLNNDEIRRYSRHLILPEVGLAGQKKIAPPASCASARADSARPSPCIWPPPASASSASWISTPWISPTSSARFSTRTPTWAGPRRSRPRKPSSGINPNVRGRHPQHAHHQRKRARPHPALRHRRGRHGQFPDALPDQRRLRAAQEAERLWLDLPLRGPGQRVRAAPGRAVLSLSLSRTAAARHGAELRRRRRAGRVARHHRLHPGHGNSEARPGQRHVRSSAACCCSTRST